MQIVSCGHIFSIFSLNLKSLLATGANFYLIFYHITVIIYRGLIKTRMMDVHLIN